MHDAKDACWPTARLRLSVRDLLVAGLLAGSSQALPAAPPTLPPDPIPALHEIAPGVLEYDGVRLDRKNHRITFPAMVNQKQGPIEYVLVNEKGKTHESVLKTALAPRAIQLAMLLIGLKAVTQGRETVPPGAIDSSYLQSAPKLKGEAVLVSVAWHQDGKSVEVPLENWVYNLKTKQAMSPGPWTYNGSMIEDGVFLADQDLSIIAVITDPTALVNNPRDGYNNDEIWQVNEAKVPPLDTPVEVSLALVPSSHESKP